MKVKYPVNLYAIDRRDGIAGEGEGWRSAAGWGQGAGRSVLISIGR